jgi:hypothetical protein
MRREGERNVTHLVGQLLLCCMAEIWQHIPLFLVRTCKNSKQKLAGNAAQHNKVKENLCFLCRNFPHEISK